MSPRKLFNGHDLDSVDEERPVPVPKRDYKLDGWLRLSSSYVNEWNIKPDATASKLNHKLSNHCTSTSIHTMALTSPSNKSTRAPLPSTGPPAERVSKQMNQSITSTQKPQELDFQNTIRACSQNKPAGSPSTS
jgi:hypothetical protein